MKTHAQTVKSKSSKAKQAPTKRASMQLKAKPDLQFSSLEKIANTSPGAVAQKAGLEDEELLQGKFETAQLFGALEEEELMQGKFTSEMASIQKQEIATPKNNTTGLPDNLKSGIENLSGYSMDDVKVHYNSPKPADLHAHAVAQGTDIHLNSGQEKHLPHEAWHVVQQKQGRVKPTLQMKGGVNVNDDKGLEKEADVMGEKAVQMKQSNSKTRVLPSGNTKKAKSHSVFQRERIQFTVSHIDFDFESSDLAAAKSRLMDRMESFGIIKNGKVVEGREKDLRSIRDAIRNSQAPDEDRVPLLQWFDDKFGLGSNFDISPSGFAESLPEFMNKK